jgi:hypothetical protein
MITNLNAQGRFLQGGTTKGGSPYPSGSYVGDGEVRFRDGGLEVCTNGQWQKWYGDTGTVNLTGEAESILMWAQAKMIEEARIRDLAKTNPTIADAVETLKKAEEQLKIVVALAK